MTGDTAAVQQGIGTFGNRSTALGGSTAFLAAQEVLEKAQAVVARALEVTPDKLEYRDGLVAVRAAPDRKISCER
ncbi:MAG: molybdopterin cofactor-binding domain-containing protein, partial [Thermomicrobium sp.]